MDENVKTAPVLPSRWLALLVAAVILAEGIWTMLVSVTRSLILPLVARITGGDSQSALYLGKGDVNLPDLFGSVLQLCLAGILFLIIKAWASKGTPGKAVRMVKTSKPVSRISIAPQPLTPTAQAAAASAIPVSQPAGPPATLPEVAQQAAQPQPAASSEPAQPSVQPQPAPKPAKPKKPQEVYYNIVGEPITPEDE